LKLTAITRKPSPALGRCVLEFLARQEIDMAKAAGQHEQYEALLAELGLRIISLAAEAELPDSMFVEDTAVVADEVAIMTRMGADSRRAEVASVAAALSPFRPLRWLREPATLEGGDVMRAGSIFFTGSSTRTNRAGIAQLASELEPHGYSVRPVAVRHCLHLKSACCYLGNGTILANRAWIDTAPLRELEILDVAPEEPWAANVVRVGDTVLIAASSPGTAGILERAGYHVRTLDISELMKAEAGLTCSSLIFET
jgi:dimethylargininase